MTAIADAGDINPTDARALTDRIKVAVEGTWHLITEAYTSRAWSALGYASWDDYCQREFGASRIRLPREDRTETVQSLRAAGLSLRAISSAIGDSPATVMRTLRAAPSVSNETPAAEPIVDHTTGEVLMTAEEVDRLSVYDGVSEEEFDQALLVSRAQDDLSHENVVANLPPRESTPITGLNGRQYSDTGRKAPRKPLVDVAKTRGFALRSAVDSLMHVFEDDRYRTNEKQVADALRGHLLYVAETVAAVLDQLP